MIGHKRQERDIDRIYERRVLRMWRSDQFKLGFCTALSVIQFILEQKDTHYE